MISLFCTPRPFKKPFIQLQKNTLASWKALRPKVQVILIEDEQGTTKKVAEEFGFDYIRNIHKNQYGSLLLDDVFRKVKKKAEFPILAQVNIDILLFNNFLQAIERIPLNRYFMVGQRHDMKIDGKINTRNKNWDTKILRQAARQSQQHALAGSDYWVFPKKVEFDIPPFIVGRPAADNWLIYKARALHIPVIDASQSVTIIHQNHPRMDGQDTYEVEKKINQDLYKKTSGNRHQEGIVLDLSDTNYLLTKHGIKKKPFTSRQIFRHILYARYCPSVLGQFKQLWLLIADLLEIPFWVGLKLRSLLRA